ncbi:MAG: MerR family transcriptional regulator, partial [Pseudomonadota bacterium]
PNAFRTISEVSETLDVPAHVLRFWESKFPAVKPVKRGGGRRYYRPEDVTLLVGIRELLYEDGLTIKGVQKIFRERGQRHVVQRGAEAIGAPLPVDASPARAAEAGRVANGAVKPAEAPPQQTAAQGAPDAERVRAVISKLEALRDRLRSDPGAR